ncbi:DUF805 domain-containing protein, partial [Erwinia amylovora]|uniref:DUF805 domain-containing protein n=1 Tax=Erwinia amylovora TaxID=552 RepID=UPI000FE2BB29
LLCLCLLLSLAVTGPLETQPAAFCVVALLWPTRAVLVKRLHDRNKGCHWALLVVVAWMLMAGNWALLPNAAQWLVGRFIPTLILIGMLGGIGGVRRPHRRKSR